MVRVVKSTVARYCPPLFLKDLLPVANHPCLQKIQRSSMLHFLRHIQVHSLNIYGLTSVGPHSSSNSFVGIERPSRCGSECYRRSQALRREHVTDMEQIAMQLGRRSGTPRCIRACYMVPSRCSRLKTRGFCRFNVDRVGSHVVAEPYNRLPSQAILMSRKLTNRRSKLAVFPLNGRPIDCQRMCVDHVQELERKGILPKRK